MRLGVAPALAVGWFGSPGSEAAAASKDGSLAELVPSGASGLGVAAGWFGAGGAEGAASVDALNDDDGETLDASGADGAGDPSGF